MMMFRKILFQFIFCMGVALALLIAMPRNAGATVHFEEAIITGDQVNMRLRPCTEAPIVLKFSETTRIGVFCEENGDWYRIIYGNYRGYVAKEYVFLSSTDVLVGNVLQDDTKVYSAAGTYGEQLTTLSAGVGVTIKNIAGDYFEVEYEESGKTGYILKGAVQTSTAKTAVTLLKEGMEGVEVKKMQAELRKRGFLGASATGHFGETTKQAVVDFQKEAKIAADGVAGAATLELLYGDNDIKTTAAKKAGITGKVQLSDWSDIQKVFKRGTHARVTDVKTGIQFNVMRFGGWFHADSEPLTKEDTAKLKKAAGGSWTWNRRAIWLTVGNTTYAASMHSMPHMSDPVKGNGFDGHFCIHFHGSKVHENSKACPRHQAMVQYAYKAAQ